MKFALGEQLCILIRPLAVMRRTPILTLLPRLYTPKTLQSLAK